MRRVKARVTLSACQAPYSAKDSRAFQSPGCSRARTDWVMVCSSTLIAMAVIHSAKRGKPRRVNAQAKAWSRACQIDQVSVASVMMRLLGGASWGWNHLAGSDQETPRSMGYVRSVVCVPIPGNYWLEH